MVTPSNLVAGHRRGLNNSEISTSGRNGSAGDSNVSPVAADTVRGLPPDDVIFGISRRMAEVRESLKKLCDTAVPVLIHGESGTGKELVARLIHRLSARRDQAFVAVNCAAIPRDLIASELFGHEKGAFTGATQQRLGRFELAAGGSIFLDEVGELPAETQVALLRVLQEHEFERVGGSRSIQ